MAIKLKLRRFSTFLKINGTEHYPVMHREVSSLIGDFLDHVGSNRNCQLVDGTFGGGNHSVPLLTKHPNLRVLGTDLDSKVMENCREQYAGLIKEKRLALEHSNYINIPLINTKEAFGKRIGVNQLHDIALLDLGFSSYQLEDEARGFSYIGNDDQPLDMRFDSERDRSEQSTAFEIINNSQEMELNEIFKRFGDERFHSVLARKIIEARQQAGRAAITTTGEFKQAIRDAFPTSARDEKNQIIKRAFQAIRIATNYELLNLNRFLDQCPTQVL